MNKIAIFSALIVAASSKAAKVTSYETFSYPCGKWSSTLKTDGGWSANWAAALSYVKGSGNYNAVFDITLTDESIVMTDGCEFLSTGAWKVMWTPISGTTANETLWGQSMWTNAAGVCTGTLPHSANLTNPATST